MFEQGGLVRWWFPKRLFALCGGDDLQKVVLVSLVTMKSAHYLVHDPTRQ